jgi:hypothetical protein
MDTDDMKCIVCGCTEFLACQKQNTSTETCFWVWQSEEEPIGLCSACATTPVEEIDRCLSVHRLLVGL